jgi:hypothetical protein
MADASAGKELASDPAELPECVLGRPCCGAVCSHLPARPVGGTECDEHGDRYGHARLLIPALPVAALGMATMMASALWNLAYDAGYDAGPAVFGLIFVRTGYPAAFALTGALILVALPVAWRERKAATSVARPA